MLNTVLDPITMGLMDKVKSAAAKTDNVLGESVDNGKLRTKIADEEIKVKDWIKELGQLVYDNAKAPVDGYQAKVDELVKNIDESKEKIAQYEAEIKENKEKGKEERSEM